MLLTVQIDCTDELESIHPGRKQATSHTPASTHSHTHNVNVKYREWIIFAQFSQHPHQVYTARQHTVLSRRGLQLII